MPVTVARLRRWFALAAIAVVVVVAGFYFYARMRVRGAVEQLNTKLGVDIQQTSQGFSLSKSQGGRTLFTVHASQAVQYKQGGRAELRDVSIVVFGRTGDRFDQIYGSDFEYDPQTGNIVAKGVVHIDLEANAQGSAQPDLALPKELKNPIHLKTSGLVFNQNSGVARTDQELEFQVPQARGTAIGASYDSKSNTMTLESQVRIQAAGAEPADIVASRGVITKEPRRAVLERVRVTRPGSTLDADQVTVFLRPDNSVDRLVAAGDVRAAKTGPTAMLARAPRAEFAMTARNDVRSGVLSGGVSLDATGERPMQARASRVLLDFGPKNQLDQVHALGDVRLVQPPAAPVAQPSSTAPSQSQTVEINADAMDFLVKNGRLLERASTSGAAQIVLTQAATATQPQTRTVATAGRFVAAFGRDNRLQTLTGSPDSRIVSFVPGEPQKVSTARLLTVEFSPAGQIVSLSQEGDFHYTEAQRSGWAGRAVYTAADQMLVLTGSPRLVETGMTTTADTVRLSRRTDQATAQGHVKTTYSELKPQPNGALLATGDPVHVTAQAMTAHRASGTAQYTGDARLWHGANIVQAPVIDFDREHRTLIAQSTAGHPVSTVFVQQDKKGKVTPVNVTAARLNYADAQRIARFSGGVVIKGSDATVTADQVDVFLQPRTQGSALVGPSQLDHAVAQGHVVVQEPNRRAKGDRLVYTAAEQKFVLTGGPPSIFDAEHGTTTGDSLTFFSRDDRVLVEGKTSPTVTQTRVAK
jgi:lipopolysaccharide export system protein LptA